MEKFFEGLSSWVATTLQEMILSIADLTSLAGMTPQTFNQTIWNNVNNFSSQTVKPIAWSILSLFLLLELTELLKKTESRGKESVYFVLIIVFKIGVAKTLMDNSSLIINTIFEIGNSLTSAMSAYINTANSTFLSEAERQQIIDSLNVEGIGSFLGLLCNCLIILLLSFFSWVLTVIARLIIILRYVEAWVFTAIAPLPFATMPSQEYGSIFKNFVKRLISLALHAVLITVCLFIYSQLATSSYMSAGAGTLGALWKIILCDLLLVIMLFQSGGWAKSIADAH